VDAKLVVHDASDAFWTLVGASREDAIGAPLAATLPANAAAIAADGGELEVELGGRPVRLRVGPLPGTEPPRAVVVLVESANDFRFAQLCATIRTIKHEINNPLTGALGNITLLLRRPDLDEKTRKRLVTAEQELKKIGQIVVRLAELAPSNRSSVQ
jgi:signal transduction histidine kinase